MPLSVPQTSFVGGEWASSLHSRTELAKYSTAVKKMRNFFPHPHGPASNRGGLEYIGEVFDSTKQTRLIPFQFTAEESYLLEVSGAGVLRVWHNDALVLEPTSRTLNGANGYKWTLSGSGTGEYYLEKLAGGAPVPRIFQAPLAGSVTYTNGPVVVLALGALGSLAVNSYAFGDNDTLGYDTLYVRVTGSIDPDSAGTVAAQFYVGLDHGANEALLPSLKFVQRANTMYITAKTYSPRKLELSTGGAWTLSTFVRGPSISAPGSFARSSGAGTGNNYCVVAITDMGEESVKSNTVTNAGPGDTFTWSSVTGASYYAVYKDGHQGGTFGFIGNANSTTFTEPAGGISPDYTVTPQDSYDPFSGSSTYPACAAFFEQRLVYASSEDYPQTVFGSVLGSNDNFNRASPIREDSAYEFTIDAQQLNEIRHLVPLTEMLIFTAVDEWKMSGGAGTVSPTNVNMKRQSKWGASEVNPLVIGNSVLFVEKSGNRVRDYTYSDTVAGYAGNDLSILANHLMKGKTITEWAHQQTPDSIVWCIRSDGTLLGLTYHREHEVWGWHRHDTDGFFESVACLEESKNYDDVYFVISRTINGSEKRYIEKMKERLPQYVGLNYGVDVSVEDAFFVDCGLTYDGYNYDLTKSLTLSGGTTWAVGESLVLTATGHTPFSVSSVGKFYLLRDGTKSVKVEVTAYTSSTQVTVEAVNRAVPVELRTSATVDWALLAKTFSGLSFLEGKDVVVLASGNVERNLTVTAGAIEISQPAAKVHIGLPYVSEIETLDFEFQTPTGTAQDKLRDLTSCIVRLEDTRALFIGPNEGHLDEIKFRDTEDYDEPTRLFTGSKEAIINSSYEREGRIFLRNVDPVPVTISAVIARIDSGEN